MAQGRNPILGGVGRGVGEGGDFVHSPVVVRGQWRDALAGFRVGEGDSGVRVVGGDGKQQGEGAGWYGQGDAYTGDLAGELSRNGD